MSARWPERAAAGWLRPPGPADTKYRRGVLGARTGSAQYPGAAVLTVSAAWRVGTGLVRYVPPVHDQAPDYGLPAPAAAVLAARPETVFGEHPGRPCDAWLLGSGTDPAVRSTEETARLRELLRGPAPVVIDAGALELLLDGPAAARLPRIITPHAGEFARLWSGAGLGPLPEALHEPFETVQRGAAALRLAAALGVTVLLKGAISISASPGGRALHTGPATSRLASAGTGDVLAGILGGLVAQHAARMRSAPELLCELGATAALLHDRAARAAATAGGTPPARGDAALGDAAREHEHEHEHEHEQPILALDVARAIPQAVVAVAAEAQGPRDAAAAP
ncbi:ADP-dependent NAD(P)H-hydrate dehydratase [Leucobacter luti]|uniref:ADP-dependent (S)-NAD(P)H-hydrate dehydratase n=1 Tax=Leucobacter luti TaxID=340320 RepID=A0A4Q7TQM1_9MICO|nr:ADP/ATP-dependent (S)-NAD(P)H-hydrate dehydratase [Leucobacter luti]MBL3699838.1 NAD(P)H-hydrate dehydratase [Leucobacter luti]RZT62843.1 NAD(P)H-hydrate repair Nnr-like enzyme with NAD(P)H-hydrate dehydratase domain [Leucobacter luti]